MGLSNDTMLMTPQNDGQFQTQNQNQQNQQNQTQQQNTDTSKEVVTKKPKLTKLNFREIPIEELQTGIWKPLKRDLPVWVKNGKGSGLKGYEREENSMTFFAVQLFNPLPEEEETEEERILGKERKTTYIQVPKNSKFIIEPTFLIRRVLSPKKETEKRTYDVELISKDADTKISDLRKTWKDIMKIYNNDSDADIVKAIDYFKIEYPIRSREYI